MKKILHKIEQKLPLYEVSKKIKQEYFDAYDLQFYKQLRFFNVLATLLYTAGVVMELFSGVQGSYLIFDIIFMIVAVVIIAGVIFAHLTQKIMLNYWISILLLIRICFGLIQPYFPGITFFIGPEYAIIWGFVSYTAMDCLLFLIINVSHKKKILAPVLVHMFTLGSLLNFIFQIIDRPKTFQEQVVVGFFGSVVILSVIYKLYLQKNVLEQILYSLQTKQESKEYILDMLQEGIMIISQKIDKKSLVQSQSYSIKKEQISSALQNFDTEPKIEFMNTFLRKILGIQFLGNRDFNQNKKLVKEIFEKQIIEESLEFNEKDVSRFENSNNADKLIIANKGIQVIDENKSPKDIISQIKQFESKFKVVEKKAYSIKKLLDEDFNEIGKKVFSLTIKNNNQESPNSALKDRHVQIKLHKTQFGDHQEIAIQIIDISLNIINMKQKNEIDLENQIRGWCCHELRNPLNSIVVSTELIENHLKEEIKEINLEIKKNNSNEKQVKKSQKIQMQLKILKYSSKMLKFFVQDMLDFQHIRADKLRKDITSFNLKEAIDEVNLMLEYISKNNQVIVQIEYRDEEANQDPNFRIKTDCLRLQQILLNLLSNALKYTQKGGFVKIIVDFFYKQLVGENREKFIRILVWDNGLGISPENQLKLFKLFGTIENDKDLNKKGIGLGLYICKKICNQFGGDIEVVSDLGVGSMFTYSMKIYDLFNLNSEKEIQKIQDQQLGDNENQIQILKNNNFIVLNDSSEEIGNSVEVQQKQQFFEDINISESSENDEQNNQNEINSSKMNDIIKNLFNQKLSENSVDDNCNIQLNIADQEILNVTSNRKKQKLYFSILEPNLNNRKKFLKSNHSEEEFMNLNNDKKGLTFNQISNINNKLNFEKVNQRIKNKFKLELNQDLLNQINEFKKKPLVKFEEENDGSLISYSQNGVQYQQMSKIKDFYKNIDIKVPQRPEQDIQNDQSQENIVDLFLNNYQTKKRQIFDNDNNLQFQQNEEQTNLKQENTANMQIDDNQINSSRTEEQYSFVQSESSNLKEKKSLLNDNQRNEQIFKNSIDIEMGNFSKVQKQNELKQDDINNNDCIQLNQNDQIIFNQQNQNSQQKIQENDISIQKSLSFTQMQKYAKQEYQMEHLNQKGPRIMIVDDVFFNIEIMKDVLHQVLKIDVDHEVVEANNGKEAVIKYMKLHKQYGNKCPIQLILMDCDMPVMNGFRATQYILKYANEEMFKIKEIKQKETNQIDSSNEIEMKVPVIVAVTGDSNAKQQEKAKKAGMKLMVSKPISSKDLKNLLKMYGII